MEDEKKKKKNKKKKNKQQMKASATSADDTASSNAGETSSVGGEVDNGSNIIVDDKGVHNADASVPVDNEKQHWLQEEAKLRNMVKQLLYEKDSYIQRQGDLEMRMKQLQSENDSWHQIEVSLEERISQLLQEKAALSFEEKSSLEKIQQLEMEKVFLAEKENLSEELVSNLNNENARLKIQVLELEEARTSLLQENKQLQDNISTLSSRVQDLKTSLMAAVSPSDAQKDVSEKENLNAEIEEVYALVGKLMTENAELVEKVNKLSLLLGQAEERDATTSVDVLDYSIAGPVSKSYEDIQDVSLSAKSVKLYGSVPMGDERIMSDEMDPDYANVVRHSSETTVSGEIVQIPLDEYEPRDLEAQAYVIAEDEGVPLADAPLIGAPFRLISFVAKFVSGADLVNKDSSNSLQ